MRETHWRVSEACQINDLDHLLTSVLYWNVVSEACQINDLDHEAERVYPTRYVSEACQINDLDHAKHGGKDMEGSFRSLSDQ